MDQPSGKNEWDIIKICGFHFIHININSHLTKTAELPRIASMSNAAVIGIGESKLDNFILDSDTR